MTVCTCEQLVQLDRIAFPVGHHLRFRLIEKFPLGHNLRYRIIVISRGTSITFGTSRLQEHSRDTFLHLFTLHYIPFENC